MNLISHLYQLEDRVNRLDGLFLPLTKYPDVSLQFYNMYTNANTAWLKGDLTGVGDGFVGSGYLGMLWCRWVGFRVTITDCNNVPFDWQTKFRCGWDRSKGNPGQSILHVNSVPEDFPGAVKLQPMDEYGPPSFIMDILNSYFHPTGVTGEC